LFTQPVLPDLVEAEKFTGTLMHTARWDHSVDLRDARVAVLGTGSTASQLIPEVAKEAKKVYSVQRSPTWILPKPDRPYTDREKWLFAHVPFAKKIYRTRLWLRSESNISVIENGSDKTQEFKGIALRVLESTVADFIAKIDEWMAGTVWLTKCSNYFRAANGRVVTQWPRSARAFWGMTRRFRPADYTFDPPPEHSAVEAGSQSAVSG
jgi:cation diffusion facilitator CzcD-associated flavoprotein CzcO